MKKSMNYKEAMKILASLTEDELDSFVHEVLMKLGVAEPSPQISSPKKSHCNEIIAEINPSVPDCPYCGAKADLGCIVKNGWHRGAQRYKCKSCNTKFVSTTNTAFSRTRKSADTWRKFIEMTIAQKSLAECAEECGICIQTAFNWRHKILNAFVVNQESVKMTGRVEVDDTFFSVSFKGNHFKGSFGKRKRRIGEGNGIPRDSYKRGSDNKSKVQAKACVMCMVQNENKSFYASVPGIGPANAEMLQATVGKHIVKESARVFSDNAKDTIRFFENNEYEYRSFASNISENRHDHKPEIDGDEHIQNVNSMHTRLRKFLKKYNGVSTKYLGNYVAFFAWLDNVKAMKQKKNVHKVSTARASVRDCYITKKEIYGRPMIPTCSAA